MTTTNRRKFSYQLPTKATGSTSFVRGKIWLGLPAASLASLITLTSCAAGPVGSIGAFLGKRPDGRLFVRDAPAGLAADRAGLAAGDEIVAIDGRAARAMTPDDVSKALRGKVGTRVTLTVDREGALRDVRLERAPLEPPPAR